MAHKKKHGAPVPPGNQSQSGSTAATDKSANKAAEVSSAQEQDPKRRLGDFEGKAEHSMQEPGGKNGANH